jgi:acyl dehydratase
MYIDQLFIKEFALSPEVYESFKLTFKDFNLLHTDDLYAQSKGFRERVMHGNILCGFLSCFVGEMLPDKNTIIHSSQITYRKPCYLNDIVFLEARLDEIYESVNAFLFKFKFKVDGELKALGSIQVGLLD